MYGIVFFILLSITKTYASKDISFLGKETWFDNILDDCRIAKFGNTVSPDLKCFWVNDKMHIFKLEILSRSPILIRYHQLIHRRECRRLISDVNNMELVAAGVSTADPDQPLTFKSHRMANSTWVDHTQFPGFQKLFNRLQRTLLSLDLSKAEHFQVLSYQKYGHYAPHYDFIDADVKGTIANNGNRLATVLTVLQTARSGGITSFPMLNVNIRPNVGDVILWHNMRPDLKKDFRSLHGACPILDGTKIAASLWVRDKGQELRLKTTDLPNFAIERYLEPAARPEDKFLYTESWKNAI